MKTFVKVLAWMIGIIGTLFTVYIFNLDMKFVARFVDPILKKHYDTMERKQYV